MEGAVKNRVILILAVLTVIFFILSINSCLNSRRQRVAKDKEIGLRMDLEEKINKFAQEKSKSEDKIKTAQQALEEEKQTHETTKKMLSQEQLVNKTLREELERVTKLKETLEEDLKEALVNKPSKSQK